MTKKEKWLRVTFEDGSEWDIPLGCIISDRADHYAKEFDGDFDEAYEESEKLFASDPYAAKDWASGNMDWKDVQPCAQLHRAALPVDYEDQWINADKEVV